jgi:tetratricopeptide (TPR) repeat protein
MILQPGCLLWAQDIPATTSSDEARRHYEKGIENVDYFLIPQAKEEFQKAVEADPEFGVAYYNLYTLAFSPSEGQEYLARAMAQLEKVTEPERLLILSAKAVNDNNAEAALTDLKQLAALLPNSKRAHYLLGNFLYGLQKWDESEKAYRRSVEIDPTYAPPYNNLAYIYSNQGKYQDAIKSLQKYAEARPTDANPLDSMGEIYLWMGDFDNSIKGYTGALKLDHKYTPSYAGLGHNYTYTGKFEKAREQYNLIRSNARNLADSNTVYFWVAVSYMHEGKPAEAAATLLQQLEFCGLHNNIQMQAAIHGQLGRVYMQAEQYDKALAEVELERQLAMDPQFQPGGRSATIMDGLFTETMICAKIGKKERADAKAAEFSKCANETGNPLAINNTHTLNGIKAYWAKDYKTALSELEQGNPLNQESNYYLGLSQLALGNKTEAKKIFIEITKFNQNSLINGMYRRAAAEKLQA